MFQFAWEDGERVFHRGWRHRDDGNPQVVLAVQPAARHPSPSSLERLSHEYGLKGELDSAWAARPLELIYHDGRTLLIIEDCGSEPLDRQLGATLSFELFLRIAIGIAAA